MAGQDSNAPFQRIQELEREIEALREQLRKKQAELEEADSEIERLRQELNSARRASRQPDPKRKKKKGKPKRPGRKPGEGSFVRRAAPDVKPSTPPPAAVPVTVTRCPCCGGELKFERVDEVSNTDIPPQPEPEIRRYQVEVFRCQACGQKTRGTHPDVAADQYGATAHRVGRRVMAAAHTIHYGYGVPVRKIPPILRELTGVTVTQSALTQDALRRSQSEVGAEYQALRAGVCQQPTVNTDDTGFRINAVPAYVMAFDTPVSTVYQIRLRHRNEEVRELIPADYGGVMGTDRGKSYDAEQLLGVAQQKCILHIQRNLNEVLETKSGPSAGFGRKLKGLLAQGMELWKTQRQGEAVNYDEQVEKLEAEVTHHLRNRILKDDDNQRLLNGIGTHHNRGNLLRFLHQPEVEPTNNRAERALRFIVIARDTGQYAKNDRGAEAYAGFASVIRTAMKTGATSIVNTLHNLFDSNRSPKSSP
jgi:transposase